MDTFSDPNANAGASSQIAPATGQSSDALKSFSSLFKQLHRLTTQTYNETDVLLQDFVETGCEIFGLPTGIVSRIEDDTYTIRAVHAAEGGFEAGAQFDLADSYCQWVVREERVVAHATTDAALGHPVYVDPPLSSYISAPIWVDGDIYGTLNFSGVEPRGRDFAPEERDIIEVMAQSIGRFLERRKTQQAYRRAEAQLHRSQHLLMQTNRMAQVGGWEYVPATGQLHWTEEVYHLHELPLDHEPKMEEAIQHYAPEAQPVIIEAVKRAVEDGEPYDLELPFVTAKGNKRWVRALGRPVLGEDGETRLVGAFQDITERRHSSEALHRSRERLEMALSAASLGLWDWDVATGVVVFNEQWAAMLGYSLDEVTPHVDTWAELVHPDDLPRVMEVLQDHLDGRTPVYETVHRMRAKDGSWRWILDRGKVVERAEDGTPLRATGIHHDVTESKQAFATEQRLRHIIDAMPQRIVLKDRAGRYVMANVAAARFFGTTVDCLEGASDEEFGVAEDGRDFRADDREVIDSGLPKTFVETVTDEHGEESVVHVEMRPYVSRFHEERLVLVIATDITSRVRAEKALHASEAKTHAILETAEEGIITITADGRVDTFSRGAEDIFGYTEDEAFGCRIETLIVSLADRVSGQDVHALYGEEDGDGHEVDGQHQDGTTLPLEISVTAVQVDEGPRTFTVVVRDLTQEKEAQRKMRRLQQEYEAVFENAQDALFFIDVHHTDEDYRFTVARINPNYQEQIGLTDEEVQGKTPREVLGEEPGAQVERHYRRCVEAGSTIEYEETLALPGGTRTWHTKLSPVTYQGTVTHLVGIARDVTNRKALENQLHYQAHHDALTDLPNRKQFFNRCQQAIELHAEQDRPFAVLFLDLDRFKNVNDSLGHQSGDALLQAAAHRIQNRLRGNDFVARLGGDEFGLILQSIQTKEGVEQVAMRLSEALEQPFELEGRDVRIGASIGIVRGHERHQDPEDLLREADVAMYRAKSRGDRYTFFDPSLVEQIRSRFFLEADLHRALKRDELRVFYQPVVNMGDGTLAGFEALVRWQHPERGLLTPGSFIDVAEKTGLVAELDRWMIRAACRQARVWREQLENDFMLLLHVNCSHRTFVDASLTQYVAQVLDEAELSPTQLALEITERAVVEDTQAVAEEMKRFKNRRVRLCIDDFGVKYSSLGILHELPVDAIKVDRRFVQQVDGPEPNDGFVRAISDLAHSMDLSLVAEGIETPRQLEVTRALGYQMGQGFLMARPMDVDAATACIEGDQPWERYWTEEVLDAES